MDKIDVEMRPPSFFSLLTMYRAQDDEKMQNTCEWLNPPLVKSHLHRSVSPRDIS